MVGFTTGDGDGGIMPFREDPRLGRIAIKMYSWDFYQPSLKEDLDLVDCIETADFTQRFPDESWQALFAHNKCLKDGQNPSVTGLITLPHFETMTILF